MHLQFFAIDREWKRQSCRKVGCLTSTCCCSLPRPLPGSLSPNPTSTSNSAIAPPPVSSTLYLSSTAHFLPSKRSKLNITFGSIHYILDPPVSLPISMILFQLYWKLGKCITSINMLNPQVCHPVVIKFF
ncbi:hypothetical protein IV203_012190 [Nitzschia inconspicua]|uniref:Uncharacterized protein n=1 Tax=Nitzschia inconspicua TaxID=303405 RepID=A0A9K3KV21_9STRA|nr:hypothetical protein IV203_012190 [Nitzschia inconspicua]